MIVSSDTIRTQLAAIWPRLEFIVLSDPEWWAPETADVAAFLVSEPDLPFVPHLYECEEQSLDLVAAQRRLHVEDYLHAQHFSTGRAKQHLNWPLGIVCGTRFAGVDMDHWQNIIVTRSGVRLVERQSKRIWAPDPAQDQIYFLLM